MDATPGQERTRERIEAVIALAAPALDLLLAVGDRVSRITTAADHEYHAVRPAGEPALLEPPGDRAR